MLKVGLIGYGFAGRTFHAPIITAVAGLQLAAVVQRHGDEAQRDYPGTPVVRSLEELLQDRSIELVVVATPNPSHFELASTCLRAGKHVVVDKPFTTTSAEARTLAGIATSQNRILSVYQNRRWDGDFRTVESLVGGGRLGEIVSYESHFDRFRPEMKENAWRERNEPGSGVLYDLAPHLIDQVLMLFGVPAEIQADVRIERESAVVDDAFDLVFFYPKMRAVLRASMLASIPGARFSVHGTRGTYLKYGMDPQEEALKRGGKPDGASWGQESEDNWGVIHFGSDGQEERVPTLTGDYRGFYENVRDAILVGSKLAVTAQDGINVMIALELGNRSSREGRRVRWE